MNLKGWRTVDMRRGAIPFRRIGSRALLVACVALVGCGRNPNQVTSEEIRRKLIPQMMADLKSETPRKRAAAAGLLGNHGEQAKEALPVLVTLANEDPSSTVRRAAETAIARIEGKPSSGKKEAAP